MLLQLLRVVGVELNLVALVGRGLQDGEARAGLAHSQRLKAGRSWLSKLSTRSSWKGGSGGSRLEVGGGSRRLDGRGRGFRYQTDRSKGGSRGRLPKHTGGGLALAHSTGRLTEHWVRGLAELRWLCWECA